MNTSEKIGFITNWIKDYADEGNFSSLVIGISGGIDSAVTLSLSVAALGSDGVTGLIMPYKHTESVDLAKHHAEQLNVNTETVSIKQIVESFKSSSSLFAEKLSEGNLHSRIRMSILYGAGFSSNRLVVGTSNKSELLIGYWTKWGDGGTDFLPIGDLYKSQVYSLGEELGVPSGILSRKPTAELWEGQTDEEEFGFTYLELDQVLFNLERFDGVSQISEKTGISLEKIAKIKKLIKPTPQRWILAYMKLESRRWGGWDKCRRLI